MHFDSSGFPTEPLTSTTAATDILSNADNDECPTNCFRPVGLAIDQQGRIFVSSDASGEIYLITRDQAASGSSPSSAAGGVGPTATTGSESSQTTSAAVGASSNGAAYTQAPYAAACAMPFIAMFL